MSHERDLRPPPTVPSVEVSRRPDGRWRGIVTLWNAPCREDLFAGDHNTEAAALAAAKALASTFADPLTYFDPMLKEPHRCPVCGRVTVDDAPPHCPRLRQTCQRCGWHSTYGAPSAKPGNAALAVFVDIDGLDLPNVKPWDEAWAWDEAWVVANTEAVDLSARNQKAFV